VPDHARRAAFRPGDRVICLDDSNGAHFLYRGGTYVIESTQHDDAGQLRLTLLGMARAWEASRFLLATAADHAAG
jgi:hypothetical protein